MHNCLVCEFSENWQKPVSVTTAQKVQFSFTCGNTCTPDCYGYIGGTGGTGSMWFELPTCNVWADGSESIPKEGCNNFKQSEHCNKLNFVAKP